PTGLEHCRLLGRPAPAGTAVGPLPGARNSPPRQSSLSPPPRRPQRLFAPHRRPRGFPFPSPPCVSGSCARLPDPRSQRLLELHRGPVPQRGVPRFLVITFVNELRD